MLAPFIIYKGKNHLSGWYQEDNIPPDWTFGVSDNGWTTNKLGLDWLRHFDKHTKKRNVGGYRLLILDDHESHDSLEFTTYCKENNIVILCMPAHSSHLLQPLDVGVFSPLKKAYGRQVEKLMRNRINHITKLEFLPIFRAAYFEAITESNARGGFRGVGLVPFDPNVVISTLDVRICTPPPTITTEVLWESKTPTTHAEFASQSKFVKSKLGSSPNSLNESYAQFVKGATKMNHRLLFLENRVAELEEANALANGRRMRKRKRIQQEGTLTFEISRAMTVVMQNSKSNDSNRAQHGDPASTKRRAQRRCGKCGETGHNSRTCDNIRNLILKLILIEISIYQIMVLNN